MVLTMYTYKDLAQYALCAGVYLRDITNMILSILRLNASHLSAFQVGSQAHSYRFSPFLREEKSLK